jgi:predicted dehydrogenase
MSRTPLSRRTFLSASAASLAALSLPSPAQTPPANQKKLGVALVGIGSLTMNQILPAFEHSALTRPVALVSGHPDKAKQQAAKYKLNEKNIYTYDTFDSLKNNPDVDIVYIVLPNSMHAEYTLRGANAGKHVLCEKPMANSPQDCQSMIDACKRADRKLMIAYRQRYEPLTQKLIELSHDPSLGPIKQIAAEAGFNIGDPAQWRLNKQLAGGGPLMDVGIYALNAIRYLSSQEPSEVSAFISTNTDDPRFKQVEETIEINLRFPSGMLASILSTYSFNTSRFRLNAANAVLEGEPINSYTGNKGFTVKNRTRTEIPYTPVNHFAAEMDHFADCIQNNKPVLTPGEEGLQDLKIITAAYQSAQENRPVKIV